MSSARAHLTACACCGLVQRVPALPPRHLAACRRCATRLPIAGRGGDERLVLAAALAGIVLYPVAVSLPIMRIERFGHASEASLVSGSLGLVEHGHLLLGALVFVCSLVLPLAKLLLLVVISGARGALSRRRRAWTYRWIERTGRWGMLDVLLVAIVVAWVKVGDLVEVRPGPAAVAFSLCVLASLVASAAFDPHALWDAEDRREGEP